MTPSFARLCTPEGIVKESCDYLKQNKNKEYIESSFGGRIKNPYFEPSVSEEPKAELTAKVEGSVNLEKYDEEFAKFELEMDDVLLKSKNLQKLPQRSIQSIKQNLLYMQQATFADLLKNESSGLMGYYSYKVPSPITDPKGSLQKITLVDLKKAMDDIDPLLFEQINTAQKSMVQFYKESGFGRIGVGNYVEKTETKFTEDEKVKYRKQLEEDFVFAKTKIIEMIRLGKTDSQLAPAQRNLIERVNKVKVDDPFSASVENSQVCTSASTAGIQNAFYQTLRTAVSFCPHNFKLSRVSSLSLLAHEIGHAIDPCNAGCTHFKVNDQISEQNKKTLKEKLNYSDEDTSIVYYPGSSDPEEFKKAFDSKKIKIINSGLNQSEHTFGSLKKCLINNEGFEDYQKNDYKYYFDYMSSVAKRNLEPLKKSERKAWKKYIDDSKKNQCLKLPFKKSQTGEMMSDVYGSQVVAQFLKDKKLSSSEDRISSLMFSDIVCIDNFYTDSLEVMNQSHPIVKHRVQSIFLKTPGIAEAFGCELSKNSKSKCLEQFRNLKYNLGQTQINPRTEALQSIQSEPKHVDIEIPSENGVKKSGVAK